MTDGDVTMYNNGGGDMRLIPGDVVRGNGWGAP
jgi:hypothetical protein